MATSTVSTDNNQAYNTQIHNQKVGDKNSENKNGKNSKDALEKELEKLLRTYEKGKAELWTKILSATTESQKDLLEALKDSPVHAALSNPDAVRDNAGTQKDIENFFMLIFKFLADHKKGQAEMEVSQAVNTEGKEKVLASVTKSAMDSVKTMKHQIDEANKKKHSLLGIILGVVMAVVTIICVVAAVFTGGGSLAGAAAADSALIAADGAATGAEVAATAGTEAAVDATAAAGEAVSLAGQGAVEGASTAADTAEAAADASETAADSAEQAADEAEQAASKAADAAKANPSDSADDLADAAQERATQARQFANSARTAATAARNAANVARTAADAVAEGAEVSGDAASEVADASSEASEAQSAVNETKEAATASRSAMEGLSRGTTRLAQLNNVASNEGKWAATKAAFGAVKAPVMGLTVAAGVGAGGITTGDNIVNSDCNNTINEATSIEQGEMTVDSSASEAIQTDIRGNMQYQQNEMSESEADNSQIQNVLQKEATMYTIGSFNA